MRDLIDVAPLREAFINSGLSYSQVCYQLGWTHLKKGKYISGDTSRLQRSLGMRPETTSYTNHNIGREHALRIANAINADLVELGL